MTKCRGPRPEELFAIAALERELGARFTQLDDGSLPGMVDGEFELADGTEGAVEVTTLNDPTTKQVDAAARSLDHIEGSAWGWLIRLQAPGVPLRLLQTHLPAIAEACEQRGITDPLKLTAELSGVSAFGWLDSVRDRVRVQGISESSRPGKIYGLPAAIADFVSDDLYALPRWVEHVLRTDQMRRKMTKLAASGRTLQHLFVAIELSGAPLDLYDGIGGQRELTDAQIDPEGSMTDLWLVPDLGGSGIRWTRGLGWSRVDFGRTGDST